MLHSVAFRRPFVTIAGSQQPASLAPGAASGPRRARQSEKIEPARTEITARRKAPRAPVPPEPEQVSGESGKDGAPARKRTRKPRKPPQGPYRACDFVQPVMLGSLAVLAKGGFDSALVGAVLSMHFSPDNTARLAGVAAATGALQLGLTVATIVSTVNVIKNRKT